MWSHKQMHTVALTVIPKCKKKNQSATLRKKYFIYKNKSKYLTINALFIYGKSLQEQTLVIYIN